MDIKISYKKTEDLAFAATHKIWDQSANGAPRNVDENSRMFIWPTKIVEESYNEDFIDVLVAPIIKVEDLPAEDRVIWPTNELFQPADIDAEVTDGIRYTLGVPKRYTLSEAKILFPQVASTRGNTSGVYVK
jgi:hypothetical protein